LRGSRRRSTAAATARHEDLIVDGQRPGGNASRDDASPIPIVAPRRAPAVYPYEDFLFEIYNDLTDLGGAPAPVTDSLVLFFDQYTPYLKNGTKPHWVPDVYGEGTGKMPYPADILHDLHDAKQDFRNWYNRAGAPTDPADNSDPKYDYLAHKSLHEYLTVERGYHPAVSDFYTRFAVDALCGTTEQANAYTSISFLGAEYNPIWSLPGGTSGIARHIVRWLVPNAFDGPGGSNVLFGPMHADQLDLSTNNTRIRQLAMAVHVDTASSEASVIYYKDGNFHRSHAKAVICAGQMFTSHHITQHLLDEEELAIRTAAFEEFTIAPVMIANVTLESAAPLVDLGLGYNQYYWGSQYWADFVTADWVSDQRYNRDRQTVLTFYGHNILPPEEMAHERIKMLNTPFSEYEGSLRDDLNRVLAPAGFDFYSDVARFTSSLGPLDGLPEDRLPVRRARPLGPAPVRTPAARHRPTAIRRIRSLRRTASSPAIESALGSGIRTALEALALQRRLATAYCRAIASVPTAAL
jgi:hypothetical protein